MLGTTVNAAAIILGSLLGLLLRGRLSEKVKTAVMQAVGVSVMFVGASGAIGSMLKPDADPLLFIISLALGGVLGTVLCIEERLERLGANLQKKLAPNDSGFAGAFTFCSILFCVGTMAILGSIQSGTENRHNILFAKAVIDGITAVIIASTSGAGVALAAVSVFLYQGALTMAAGFLGRYMSEDMLREIAIVGGIIITCIGINVLEIKRIKVANFLPAIFIPIVYYAVLPLFK